MIICKSIVKIKNSGGEILNTFEIILNRNYEEDKMTHNVELIELKKDNKTSVDVENYYSEAYYNFLKKLVIEHLSYEPSVDIEYLIRIFKKQNALEYLDIQRDSNPFSFTTDIGRKSKLKVSILTYELNANIAIKNILDLDRLVDLDEKSLNEGIKKYISNSLIHTLSKVLNIGSISVERDEKNVIELRKINNINIGKIFIDDYLGNGFKFEESNGLKIAYLRGICKGVNSRRPKIKNLSFFEFADGNHVFFIINRGNVSKSKVMELFNFDVVLFSSNIVVGIVSKYGNYKNCSIKYLKYMVP